MRDFHRCLKTKNPPLAPNGGEGSGVRGQDSLEPTNTDRDANTNETASQQLSFLCGLCG